MDPDAFYITRVELCGRLVVEVNGDARHDLLPGRQGRMLFAFLIANRTRGVSRDELMDALWPEDPPAEPAAALRTVLARTRQALGKDVLRGRHEISLRLHHDAWIDVDAAEKLTRQAESALTSGDAGAALDAARASLALAERPLLPEFAAPWVEERRRDLDELLLATLEVNARAGLALGGPQLAGAERAARAIVARAPFRESGYGLLMQIAAARGDCAEALRVFDELRVLLREELGASPSAALIDLNQRLLGVQRDDPRTVPTDTSLPVAIVRAAHRPFVGRRRELQRLRSCWSQVAGEPRLVVVTGEAGIGKTHLLANFATEVHSAGATVLYGRNDERPACAGQGFVEAFEGVAGDDLSAALHSRTGDETDRWRLCTAATSALARVAAGRRVLLVLDNMQWADDVSDVLLRRVLRSFDATQLMVIVAVRDQDIGSSRALELLADLRREYDPERLSLDGFDEDETRAFIREYADEQIPQAWAATLQRKTAGNATFLREALRWLKEQLPPAACDGADTIDGLGACEGAQELILGRLTRLGTLERQVLEAGSATGTDFRLDAMERALAEPADRLITSIERLMAAGLVVEVRDDVDRFTFRHPLVRDAVREHISGSRRLRLQQCGSPSRDRGLRAVTTS